MESNQTEFSYEKPFFEEVAQLPPDPDEAQSKTSSGIKAWIQSHLLITTIMITLLILLLIVGIAALILQPKVKELELMNIGTTESSPIPVSPLEQKITYIKTELNAADPTRGQEPFPPIDMDIRLDSTQR